MTVINVIKERRFLLAVFLLLGLVYFLLYSNVYHNFSDELVMGADDRWLVVAKHLYSDGSYSRGERDPQGHLLGTSTAPPVHPILFWFSYSLFGMDDRANEFVRVVQIFMQMGIVFFSYKIGRIFSKRVGYIVAVLAALDFTMFYFALNYMVPNTLLALFFTLSLYYLILFIKVKPSYKNIFFSSLFLGLGMLTRPAVYLLWIPLLLFLLLFLYRNREHSLRKRFMFLGIFFAIIGAFFWGWKIRNYYATGSSLFTSQSGEVQLFFRAGHLLASKWRMPFQETFTILRDEYEGKVAHLSEGPKNAYLAEVGKKIILESPFEYMTKVAFVGTPTLLFGSIPPFVFFGKDSVKDIIEALPAAGGHRPFIQQIWAEEFYSYVVIYGLMKLYLAVLYFLAFLGLVLLYVKRREYWIFSLLVLMIGYMLITSAAPDATSRYRAPYMPIFYLLAAFGITYMMCSIRHRTRPSRS